MRTVRHVMIGVTLAWALVGSCAEYAGWTVGNVWNGYGTILRSTDSGASWFRQGAGQVADVGLSGVTVVDPYTAWVVGDANASYATIYHTTDGGLTWDRKGSAAQVPNTSLLKVTTFGDNNVWAVGSGTILHSGDGGATWANQIPAGYESVHLQGVYTPDGVHVWVTGDTVGGFATILHSGDGGLTWTRQTGGDVSAAAHLLGISAVDANTAWTVGGNLTGGYNVLATTDGGLTWTQQYSIGLGDANEVSAVNASTVWVAADSEILWSTNGGQNWTGYSSPSFTLGISAVDSQQAWAVSMEASGTILHTTNGGNSWVEMTQLDGQNLPGLQTVSFSRDAIPEPSSAALLVLGLAAMLGRSRRRS